MNLKGPNELNMILAQAKEAVALKNFQKSKELLENFLTYDQQNPWVYAFLAYSLYNLNGKSQENIYLPYLQKAIDLGASDHELYNFLGLLIKDLLSLDQAVNIFAKSITLKPDYYDAYFNLGVTFFF